ncbi:MAG: hypothetical protein LLG04_01395 [Parachlamydia sp.]|nr:hypothetical protein [Parachlamydia sp.]
MSVTNISSPVVQLANCHDCNRPNKKMEQWLGVHCAKRTDHIRWQGMAAAVILAVGAALFAFVPFLGGVMLGAGAVLGIKVVIQAARGNPLENAVNRLAGGKDKLEKLPVLNWFEVKNRKRTIHQSQAKDLLEAMTANVMCITDQGKTQGLAVKYVTVKAQHTKTSVRLYFFREPYDNLAHGALKLVPEPCSYSVHDKMTAKKGRALEEMIRSNNFIVRK